MSPASVRKFLANFDMAAGDAKGVVHHQNLTVGHVAAPIPMTGIEQRVGDAFASSTGYTFQHQQLCACRSEGIIKQRLRGITASLHL